jgi:hypothetical protein
MIKKLNISIFLLSLLTGSAECKNMPNQAHQFEIIKKQISKFIKHTPINNKERIKKNLNQIKNLASKVKTLKLPENKKTELTNELKSVYYLQKSKYYQVEKISLPHREKNKISEKSFKMSKQNLPQSNTLGKILLLASLLFSIGINFTFIFLYINYKKKEERKFSLHIIEKDSLEWTHYYNKNELHITNFMLKTINSSPNQDTQEILDILNTLSTMKNNKNGFPVLKIKRNELDWIETIDNESKKVQLISNNKKYHETANYKEGSYDILDLIEDALFDLSIILEKRNTILVLENNFSDQVKTDLSYQRFKKDLYYFIYFLLVTNENENKKIIKLKVIKVSEKIIITFNSSSLALSLNDTQKKIKLPKTSISFLEFLNQMKTNYHQRSLDFTFNRTSDFQEIIIHFNQYAKKYYPQKVNAQNSINHEI